MKLSSSIQAALQQATAKALATTGPMGVNVVPVSVMTVTETTITLYDFFMHKTSANCMHDVTVALAAWDGLTGVQVKATVRYETEGSAFTEATALMKERFPDRQLRGLLQLTPVAVYDVSAGQHAGELLAE